MQNKDKAKKFYEKALHLTTSHQEQQLLMNKDQAIVKVYNKFLIRYKAQLLHIRRV